ncbi:GAF and ANTAR domain-containing protein [soil metagenome]
MTREAELVRAFVGLADTLVSDYDVTDFLYLLCDRCAEVLAVDAAGVLVSDEEGRLRLTSASNERMQVLELFEMQRLEGPCFDAYQSGTQVVHQDLASTSGKCPDFSQKAVAVGFRAVYAFPLRLRNDRMGALNLFREDPGSFDADDVDAAQALADVATIGILQERAVSEAQIRARHLQDALSSRVVIEQAKGIVAERQGIDLEQAFQRLRAHARGHNRRLRALCQDVVDGALPAP